MSLKKIIKIHHIVKRREEVVTFRNVDTFHIQEEGVITTRLRRWIALNLLLPKLLMNMTQMVWNIFTVFSGSLWWRKIELKYFKF